jgi:hypothetical protein
LEKNRLKKKERWIGMGFIGNIVDVIKNNISSLGVAELDDNGKVPLSQLPSNTNDINYMEYLGNNEYSFNIASQILLNNYNIDYEEGGYYRVPYGKELDTMGVGVNSEYMDALSKPYLRTDNGFGTQPRLIIKLKPPIPITPTTNLFKLVFRCLPLQPYYRFSGYDSDVFIRYEGDDYTNLAKNQTYTQFNVAGGVVREYGGTPQDWGLPTPFSTDDLKDAYLCLRTAGNDTPCNWLSPTLILGL